MSRFRFTILAVCLVMLFLGASDLQLLFNNPEPAVVDMSVLEHGEAPREWLSIEGGYWNLEQAISTTGTVELEAFLIPLRSTQDKDSEVHVIFESSDPEIVKLLQTYYFSFDSMEEQADFRAENSELFYGQANVTGLVVGGLIESGTRDKLLGIAQDLNMPLSENVVLLSQGKEPEKFRGFFFAVIAVLGPLRFIQMTLQNKKRVAGAQAKTNESTVKTNKK